MVMPNALRKTFIEWFGCRPTACAIWLAVSGSAKCWADVAGKLIGATQLTDIRTIVRLLRRRSFLMIQCKGESQEPRPNLQQGRFRAAFILRPQIGGPALKPNSVIVRRRVADNSPLQDGMCERFRESALKKQGQW